MNKKNTTLVLTLSMLMLPLGIFAGDKESKSQLRRYAPKTSCTAVTSGAAVVTTKKPTTPKTPSTPPPLPPSSSASLLAPLAQSLSSFSPATSSSSSAPSTAQTSPELSTTTSSSSSSSSSVSPTQKAGSSWDEQSVGRHNVVVAPGKIPSNERLTHIGGHKAYALVLEGETPQDFEASLKTHKAAVELAQKMACLQRYTHAAKMLARDRKRAVNNQRQITKRLELNRARAEKEASRAATNSSIVRSNTAKTLEEITALRATLGMSPFTSADPKHPAYTKVKPAPASEDGVMVPAASVTPSPLTSSSSTAASSSTPSLSSTPAPTKSSGLLGLGYFGL